uniref:CCHC-type domain-containing protein n=1 Tax=Chromera velia CCMP2878 TaxID=1169474 RepID=A0A0G4HNX6_9ALVE|eukprot:Cvel_29715.t1-p1 / transcript=Cvel_29715.t1 / gene=Cvel_29715 / organism=Chromera_velia_CCMP2878 / gene_product=hypothetical protein / transcript_product=hypothetical protein / location=Cvel_scaffold4119:2844-4805(+) / protein_length=654 / sequence_SO=supercontig / SO=protein_coding / is_pseudo=false
MVVNTRRTEYDQNQNPKDPKPKKALTKKQLTQKARQEQKRLTEARRKQKQQEEEDAAVMKQLAADEAIGVEETTALPGGVTEKTTSSEGGGLYVGSGLHAYFDPETRETVYLSVAKNGKAVLLRPAKQRQSLTTCTAPSLTANNTKDENDEDELMPPPPKAVAQSHKIPKPPTDNAPQEVDHTSEPAPKRGRIDNVGTTKLNLPNPTVKADTLTFSGERSKANEFWLSFKADCVVHKWDLNFVVYYFRKAMRGTALTWWTSEMEEKVEMLKTIENLHACFEAQFGITEAEKDAAEDLLDNLVQDAPAGETIRAYVERVAALCRQARVSRNDPKILKKFKKGIFNETVRTILTTKTYSSLDEIVKEAEKLAHANSPNSSNAVAAGAFTPPTVASVARATAIALYAPATPPRDLEEGLQQLLEVGALDSTPCMRCGGIHPHFGGTCSVTNNNRCFNCGGAGHIKVVCPRLPTGASSSTRRPNYADLENPSENPPPLQQQREQERNRASMDHLCNFLNIPPTVQRNHHQTQLQSFIPRAQQQSFQTFNPASLPRRPKRLVFMPRMTPGAPGTGGTSQTFAPTQSPIYRPAQPRHGNADGGTGASGWHVTGANAAPIGSLPGSPRVIPPLHSLRFEARTPFPGPGVCLTPNYRGEASN